MSECDAKEIIICVGVLSAIEYVQLIFAVVAILLYLFPISVALFFSGTIA